MSTESCYRTEQLGISKRLPVCGLRRQRAFRGPRDTRRCDGTQTRAGGESEAPPARVRSCAHEPPECNGRTRRLASSRNHATDLDQEPSDLCEVREALGCVWPMPIAPGISSTGSVSIKRAPPRKERLDLNAAINEVIVLARSGHSPLVTSSSFGMARSFEIAVRSESIKQAGAGVGRCIRRFQRRKVGVGGHGGPAGAPPPTEPRSC